MQSPICHSDEIGRQRGGLGKCAENERAVGLGTKAGYATSAEASRDAQVGRRKTGKLHEMVGGLVKKSAINCKTTSDNRTGIAHLLISRGKQYWHVYR